MRENVLIVFNRFLLKIIVLTKNMNGLKSGGTIHAIEISFPIEGSRGQIIPTSRYDQCAPHSSAAVFDSRYGAIL